MLKVQLLDPRAIVPTCAHPGEDLAYDIYALEDTAVDPALPCVKIRTGIAAYFDPPSNGSGERRNYGLLVRDRSSMAAKGLFVTAGVIDAGYRGEIVILMSSQRREPAPYQIQAGDKIAQLIPLPVLTSEVEVVAELPATSRGAEGFGSTGR